VAALFFVTTHTYEHYGNLVTYMLQKGIVPPSSAPAKPTKQTGSSSLEAHIDPNDAKGVGVFLTQVLAKFDLSRTTKSCTLLAFTPVNQGRCPEERGIRGDHSCAAF
jgi:hypothetical protein